MTRRAAANAVGRSGNCLAGELYDKRRQRRTLGIVKLSLVIAENTRTGDGDENGSAGPEGLEKIAADAEVARAAELRQRTPQRASDVRGRGQCAADFVVDDIHATRSENHSDTAGGEDALGGSNVDDAIAGKARANANPE